MILFSDFDRTLYFIDDPERTKTNFEAIKRWKDAGHSFCIATGRSYQSVTKEAPIVQKLCDYYIVDSGSILLDRSANLMYITSFLPETISQIENLSRTLIETPSVTYYTPSFQELFQPTDNITKIRLWFKDPDIIQDANQIVSKLPVLAFTCFATSSRPELAGYTGFIEITPKNSGKASAISVLVKTNDLQLSDIITVGDSENDISMLQDFDGYMINGSTIDQSGRKFKATPSVADLINSILEENLNAN